MQWGCAPIPEGNVTSQPSDSWCYSAAEPKPHCCLCQLNSKGVEVQENKLPQKGLHPGYVKVPFRLAHLQTQVRTYKEPETQH